MILGTLRLHESSESDAVLALAAKLGWGIDTADVYGPSPHHTERRVGTYSGPRISKGGLARSGTTWRPDGRAKHLLQTAKESQSALGNIDTYLLHTVDPSVPLARSWRALQRLKRDGIVSEIGLSNPTHPQLLEALALGDLHTVQVALSPFELSALRSGIVRIARELGVRVLAHSPLGGWRRKRRAAPLLKPVARDFGMATERLMLAWLEHLGVEPVVGCTRVETVQACAMEVPEGASQAAYDAIPQSPLASEAPTTGGDRTLVLVMGLPASGKTTRATHYTAQGFDRLNRDLEGGTLKGLVKQLDSHLHAGATRVVLDNTWPTRAVRNRLVEVANTHRARVICEWMPTALPQCRRQAVRRILSHTDSLPEPGALSGKGPAWAFGPEALQRIHRQFEAPGEDEGMEVVTLVPPEEPRGAHPATLVSLAALEARRFDHPVFVAAWTPDSGRQDRLAMAIQHHDIAGLITCSHPPGPARCWCRKPLPGMGLWLIHHYDLDPDHLVVIGAGADKAFAKALGCSFEAL